MKMQIDLEKFVSRLRDRDDDLDALLAADIIEHFREAVGVAADALDIAADWNVEEVQCNPPWELEALSENPEDGWCSTRALAKKLRNMSQ